MALPDFSAWRVETVRFTFFFAEPPSGRDANWWRSVTGMQPEAMTSKPAVSEHTEEGPFLDGQLEMKIAFNRLDWTLAYPFAAMPDSAPGKNLSELLEDFLPRLIAWVKELGYPAIRVAFGTTAFLVVDKVPDANKIISSYCPYLTVDQEAVRDVSIQVNHPEPSRFIDGQDVNIITKMSALTGQFMHLAMGGLPKVILKHGVRAELDYSSSVERLEPLTREVMSQVFTDFKEKAVRFFKEGV